MGGASLATIDSCNVCCEVEANIDEVVTVSGRESIGGLIGAVGVSFVSPVDSSIVIWSIITG